MVPGPGGRPDLALEAWNKAVEVADEGVEVASGPEQSPTAVPVAPAEPD